MVTTGGVLVVVSVVIQNTYYVWVVSVRVMRGDAIYPGVLGETLVLVDNQHCARGVDNTVTVS